MIHNILTYLNATYTYFVGFTLIGRHLTLQKLRPVFLDVLPCARFAQHSSKETNDLSKIMKEL